MSGRERLFSASQENELVRRIVEDYFRAEDPAKLEEVDDVFDLVHSMIDNRIGEPKTAGDRSFEGLAADPAFFAGAIVTAAIWVTTVLFRQARAPSLPHVPSPAPRSLAEVLGELTGNPQMVHDLRKRISLLQKVDRLVANEGIVGELRDVKRRVAEELQLAPTALADEPAVAVANTDPIAPRLAALPLSALSTEPDLTLLVSSTSDSDGRLEFRLKAKDPQHGLVFSDLGQIHFGQSLRTYVDELTEEIRRLHERGPSDRSEKERRLERLGDRLAWQVVPEKLTAALDRLRGRALTLLIYSDVFVPWELLRFPDRHAMTGTFWAEEFALTRWFTNSRETFALPLRRIALVVPASDLAAAKVEARTVAALETAGRQVIRLAARKNDLFPNLLNAKFDAIHFAGHGSRSPTRNPDFGRLELDSGDHLDAIDLTRESLPERPLVFLNACHSGKGGPLPTGIGGLARAFVDAGAASVVGAHWAISDSLAESFARELYRLLIAGLPLGEAGRRARLHLRQETPGDPTWIAYTIFGQPGASCPGS